MGRAGASQSLPPGRSAVTDSLLKVENIVVRYRGAGSSPFASKRSVTAVDNVSFELDEGETLGIVGESGCGKSTLARALLGLVPLASGRITFAGATLERRSQRALRPWRRAMQIIFQDPVGSLDPRMTVGDIVGEPLVLFEPGLAAAAREDRVLAMMEKVGLGPECHGRYSHEFSGGQCQRIGIARALISGPKVVICDEPVSALDVSIRAQIINLLRSLQKELKLSLLFIAHDLSVVRHISHRVLVMYLGRVAEYADTRSLFASAAHPYTRALIQSMPTLEPGRHVAAPDLSATADLPSPAKPPSGCRFRTRCPYAQEICRTDVPSLRTWRDSEVACHRVEQLPAFDPATATS